MFIIKNILDFCNIFLLKSSFFKSFFVKMNDFALF